jgi:hypothetical protein
MRSVPCIVFLTLALSVSYLFVQTETEASTDVQARYMAFCVDGDGSLSGWLSSRHEAFLIGQEHERAFRGHRWEIMVQGEEPSYPSESCSLITRGRGDNVLRVSNTCGRCMVFRMARTAGEEEPRFFELRLDPRRSRVIRMQANERLSTEGETVCPPDK